MTGNQELNQNSENLSHLQDSATEQSATTACVAPGHASLPSAGKPSASVWSAIRMGSAILQRSLVALPGSSLPDVLGDGWLGSVHPDDRAETAQHLKEPCKKPEFMEHISPASS
jgi:hypothetical protein